MVSNKRIIRFFEDGYSANEIAKKLKIEVEEVFRVLRKYIKPNRERDIELYIDTKYKLQKELIKIYRKNGYYDSKAKVLEKY